MILPNIYQLTDNGTAPRFNFALADGIHSVEGARPAIIKDGNLRPGRVALWGEHRFHKTLAVAIAEGRTWYYGDHGYFGRGIYYRITKNALQVHGSYFDGGPIFDANMARLEEVRSRFPVAIEPRKPPGDFILLCPPSEALAERSGFTTAKWIDVVTRRLKKITKRGIAVRTKPKTGNNTPAPLLAALQGAHALVTYTSNVAIEALCAGYPAFCTGPNPVHVFGNTDLKKIETGYVPTEATRTAFAAMLAANQWTLDEIRSGQAWRAVR